MSDRAWIEIELGAVIDLPAIAPMVTAKLTKGLFVSGRLALPQFPGWYVPDAVVFEPVLLRGVASSRALTGDRFYAFTAKAEAYRSHEIYRILTALPNVITLRDYCYRGSAGTPVSDSAGRQYVVRTGRLTVDPPVNPGRIVGGRTVYFEPMEFRFEQTG